MRSRTRSIIVRNVADQLEIGFIRRADNPKDPWSGQLAFPGGRMDSSDSSDLDAVIREVQEEIGLLLLRSQALGALHDVQARKAGALLPFFLRPFVFSIEEHKSLVLEPTEVSDFFWISVDHLMTLPRHVALLFRTTSWSMGCVNWVFDPLAEINSGLT